MASSRPWAGHRSFPPRPVHKEGILVFSKEGKVLTITVAKADQDTVVLLILE